MQNDALEVREADGAAGVPPAGATSGGAMTAGTTLSGGATADAAIPGGASSGGATFGGASFGGAISDEMLSDAAIPGGAVLRLVVRNHPGVMSHVCGLFARRAFNLEAILCLPAGDGGRSVVLLAANEEQRLEQVMRQLAKLEDVVEVRRAPEARRAFVAAASVVR